MTAGRQDANVADRNRTALAQAVTAAMRARGLTKETLGKLLGVDPQSANLRMLGARSFRAEELAAVADWLDWQNCTLGEIFGLPDGQT